MKKIYLLSTLLTFLFLGYLNTASAQNVGINSTGARPDTSAGLDVNFINKGMLIPRVALTSTTDITTIATPATSLLVYNTTSNSFVTPGYYYWTGTAWFKFITGAATGWGITGNTGTTPGTNFIGTVDAKDFVVKVAGTPVMRMYSGTDTAVTIISTKNTPLNIRGNVDNFLQLNLSNQNAGNNASTDFIATADNGTDNTNYIDMGINSSSYANGNNKILNGANLAYIYASGSDFYIGNSGSNKNLIFFTNNSTDPTSPDAKGTERMRITAAGQVVAKSTVTATGFITSSDRRLKTNIQNLSYGLKTLQALQPVSYNWKDANQTTQTQLGLIAQDARKIIPEIVIGDESKENLAINYTELIPVLINSIKEQQKQIDELRAELKKLKK